jgi:hypothetical protein
MRMLIVALVLVSVGCTYEIRPDDDQFGDGIDMDKSLQKLRGWQGSADLTTLGNPNNKIGPLIPLLQANFDVTDNDPGYYTVQFGAIAPTSAASRGIFRAIAILTWAVEGNNIVRQIDIGNGATISAPGQSVNIQVQDATPAHAAVGQPYKVFAQVTRGTRPFSANPPTLKGLPPFGEDFVVAAASTVIVPIPVNAGASSVLVTIVKTTGATVIAVVGLTDNAGNAYTSYDPEVVVDFVPLPPNATQVEISNNDGANNIIASITFGIDG